MIGKLARLLTRRAGRPQRILVKRAAALGDVLYTTPIVARLRRENPGAAIYVQTGSPEVYRGNPDATRVVGQDDVAATRFDRIIDLDMAYENRRNLHQISAFMEVAFGDHGDGHAPEIVFAFHDAPPPPADLGIEWDRAVALHLAKTWPSRMFPKTWWDRVAGALHAKGYKLIVIGKAPDLGLAPEIAIDTRDRLTLQQQAAVIARCRLFVCAASGLLPLSGATPTPTIFVPTITRAEHSMPYRDGVLGGGYFPIVPDIACYGCDARQPGKTYWECERGDNACLGLIAPETVVTCALQVLES